MSTQTQSNQTNHSQQPPDEIYKVDKDTVSIYDEQLGEFRLFHLETRVKVIIFIDQHGEPQGLVQIEPTSCRPDLTGVRALALATEIIGATLHVALNDMLGQARAA